MVTDFTAMSILDAPEEEETVEEVVEEAAEEEVE